MKNKECLYGHIYDYGIYGDVCPFCSRLDKLEKDSKLGQIGHDYLRIMQDIGMRGLPPNKICNIFTVLNEIRLKDGYGIGIKLAERKGIGDNSYLFTYETKDLSIKRLIKQSINAISKLVNIQTFKETKSDSQFQGLYVIRTESGAFQAYLYSIASSVLPAFWHGLYRRRKYVFSHEDLYSIDALQNNRHLHLPLFGIKTPLMPVVNLQGNEAIIHCCYWNDWQGLVREIVKVTYLSNNMIEEISFIREDVLYKYCCGKTF